MVKVKNTMKLLTAVVALAFVFGACKKNDDIINGMSVSDKAAVSSVVWNGDSDRPVAVSITEVKNDTRKNASGVKITSNAHSADFPGIYFIWDSKQKDNGYLKVASWVFTQYESFTLTAKESNTYWDFPISVQNNQQPTADECYVLEQAHLCWVPISDVSIFKLVKNLDYMPVKDLFGMIFI